MVIESFHISVCMKPIKSDFVANLLEHGVAGINIDESRVFTDENLGGGAYAKAGSTRHDGTENWRYKRDGGAGEYEQPEGRFPANIILDEQSAKNMDNQSGVSKSSGGRGKKSMGSLGKSVFGKYALDRKGANIGGLGDIGGASRYFKVIE